MLPWNLEHTQQKVKQRFGDPQLQVVRKSIESIVDRQYYAGYHFHEHKRLLGEHIDATLSSESIYELTLPFDPQQTADFELCQMRVSAHVVACVQSMHSLADILAHVVYFSAGLNLGSAPLPEHRISIHSVTRAMRSPSAFSKVSDILHDITSNSDFQYLTAVVNHSKHRSIVGTVFSVDPPATGQPPYTLLFDDFSYERKPQPRREISPFLESTYSWLSWRIVACGNALNGAL